MRRHGPVIAHCTDSEDFPQWLSSLSLETFFVLDTDSRTIGHPWKLKKRTSTDLRHYFFSERVIDWWNKMDNTTVCVTGYDSQRFQEQTTKNVVER